MPSLPLTLLTLTTTLSLITGVLAQSCDSGTFFDGAQCSPCDSACASCMSASICTVCNPQAFLAIHDGGLTCQWCMELIPGCAICSSDKSCSACSEGFVLGSNGCEAGGDAGGQVTLSASSVSCQSFQVDINGACHPSIALCGHYNPDASCNSCQEGALLIQGYCIPSSIANPNTPEPSPQSNANLVCHQRQYVANGECVTMGPACLSFMINGTCTECDQGYTLFRGLCVQDSGSDHVVVSYIPGGQSQTATNNWNQGSSPSPSTASPQGSACISPCETCSQEPSFCLSCQEGFTTVDSLPGQCFQL